MNNNGFGLGTMLIAMFGLCLCLFASVILVDKLEIKTNARLVENQKEVKTANDSLSKINNFFK